MSLGVMVDSKLHSVLHHLSSYEQQEGGTNDGTLTPLEDDTVLHKLHSHIHLMLNNKEYGVEWAQGVGLAGFVQRVLDSSIVQNPRNAQTVAFAIKVFASLVQAEANFETFADDKNLAYILIILPYLRTDPTLSSATLVLISAISADKAGLHWLLDNGMWEKMLLPCLRSASVFVQREGVAVIADVLLQLRATQYFEMMVKDLFMVCSKLCELGLNLSGGGNHELRESGACVQMVFHRMLSKTLGKEALYSELSQVVDMNSRLVRTIKRHPATPSATRAADNLILNMLHKFQEKLTSYGIFEQFLLDALCVDMFSLTRLLLENGCIESLIRSTVNAHKYWKTMTNNLKEHKDIDITGNETILIMLTAIQISPVVSVYRPAWEQQMKECPGKAKMVQKWNDEVHSKMQTKAENKNELGRLERHIQQVLESNPGECIRFTIMTVSAITSAADHLTLTTAVTVFQGLSFLLYTHRKDISPMRHHATLQRTIVDALRILVEKFNIDWRKSFVSLCLMAELCELIRIPGIATQVKVSILKAMNSCIRGFIPPVMSMLINSERLENNSVELLGQVLNDFLADTAWEVRDSALEVLLTCMKLAQSKYPYFVEWVLRYRLNGALMVALNDVEGYVRASAYNVLATVIDIDKLWDELAGMQLPEVAVTAVVREGEAVVRQAAVTLVRALYTAGKYQDEMVEGVVVPVVQRAVEDVDDEVRRAALAFLATHLQARLNQAGMVDGEFPSVTFSRGKIVKLDQGEVRRRVMDLVTWVCECGYFGALVAGLRDPSTGVAAEAHRTLLDLRDVTTKYRVTTDNQQSHNFSEAENIVVKKEAWLSLRDW